MGRRFTRRSVLSAVCGITVGGMALQGGAPTVTANSPDGRPLFDSPWPMFGADSRNTGVVAERPSVGDLDREWSVATDGPARAAAVGRDCLYVGTESGSVLALDPLTGERQWETDVDGSIVDSPAAVDDLVLVLTEDGRFGDGEVRALSAADGSSQWSESLRSTGQLGPTVESGTVYVGDSEGAYAFDVSNGDRRWFEQVPGERIGQLAVADGTVYLTQQVGDLFDAVVAIEDGSRRWSQSFEAGLRTGPVVGDGRVFIGVDDRTFRALSRENGEIEWRVPIEAQRGTRPALDRIALYVPTSGGHLIAIDVDGARVWDADVGDIRSPPMVTAGEVRVIDGDGRLATVDTSDGSVTSRVETDTVGARRAIGTQVSVSVVGSGGITGFVTPPAVEAAESIRELRSVGTETDVDVSDALDRAVDAFQGGSPGRALDIAMAALERVEEVRAAREAAVSSVETLESTLRDNPDIVAPEAERALERAREQLEAGEYETAERTAEDGLERFETRRENAAAAQTEIETLENDIESAEENGVVLDADRQLERARTAFDDGEYTRAREIAIEGQTAVETTVDEARNARQRIEVGERTRDRHVGAFRVGSDVTGGGSDDLERARIAYDEGEYQRAAELADTSAAAGRRSMYIVDGVTTAAAVSAGALLRAGWSRLR